MAYVYKSRKKNEALALPGRGKGENEPPSLPEGKWTLFQEKHKELPGDSAGRASAVGENSKKMPTVAEKGKAWVGMAEGAIWGDVPCSKCFAGKNGVEVKKGKCRGTK